MPYISGSELIQMFYFRYLSLTNNFDPSEVTDIDMSYEWSVGLYSDEDGVELNLMILMILI